MARPDRSILGDRTMLRVAGVLLLAPDARRPLAEILSALPDLGRLTVIRALNDLVEQQVLLKTPGNPPLYQANARHFLFAELRSIAGKTLGGNEALVRAIGDAQGIAYAAIYGSFAAGSAGPASDIDLLLVVETATDPDVLTVLSSLADAAHALGREINPVVYETSEYAAKRGERFLSNVLGGPLVVLKGA